MEVVKPACSACMHFPYAFLVLDQGRVNARATWLLRLPRICDRAIPRRSAAMCAGVAVVNYRVPICESSDEVIANCHKIAATIKGAKMGYPGL